MSMRKMAPARVTIVCALAIGLSVHANRAAADEQTPEAPETRAAPVTRARAAPDGADASAGDWRIMPQRDATSVAADESLTTPEAAISPSSITAQGYGEVRVRPDALRTRIAIELDGDTIEAARAQTNERARQLTAALRGLGIAGLTVATQVVEIRPVRSGYDAKAKKPPQIIGYHALTSVVVTVRATPDLSLIHI